MAVRRGHSEERDARRAIAEMRQQLWREDLELVVLFIAPDHNRAAIEHAIAAEFAGAEVIGCTTAGEITGEGYKEGAISGISFDRSHFKSKIALIPRLQAFNMEDGERITHDVMAELGALLPNAKSAPAQTFAMLLVDGMSKQEEVVVSSLNRFLDPIPLFGGSAGDGLNFGSTWVYAHGRFHQDAAILAVFQTSCPFKVFKLDHFEATGRKMVVTEADPNARLVREINGEPAAPAYARMVGLVAQELSPMIFAAHPVVVRVGGEYHVRSIQKVEKDGSLRFYCGIDEGLVLTVAKGMDMAANLSASLQAVNKQLGDVELILGFDCILRKLEAEQKQQTREVSSVLRHHKVVGFSTYGEQFRSMHVNQTFTGVAIGKGKPRSFEQAAE